MKYELNNARNCLRIFLRTAQIQELFVPYELCTVVFKAARLEGVRLKFYHIDHNFMPDIEFKKEDFILYPNYFGICDENARILAKKYPNLIYDATQSFFAEPLGIATIYSARKFFPVTDGGILVTDLNISMNFTKETDEESFSTNPMNFDYEKFLRNELKFNNSKEIKLISEQSHNKLLQINFEKEKNKRTKTFIELAQIFAPVNLIKIPANITAPMVYPLKPGDCRLAEEIVKKNIFLIRYDYMKEIIPLPLTHPELLDTLQSLK